MSLAMYAAPFDDSSIDQNLDTNNAINRKRQTAHNKTIKMYPKQNFDQEKVNSVLENVHKMSVEGGDDNIGNFNPPPKPVSIGSTKNAQTTTATDSSSTYLGKVPHPTNYQREGGLELNNLNAKYTVPEEYYKNVLPGYRTHTPSSNMEPHRRYYSSPSVSMDNNNSSSDVLIKKINYMINLLEEQQDERTHNVTEEVVLYSFLGIFIIFVVDSFTKVGKYVR